MSTDPYRDPSDRPTGSPADPDVTEPGTTEPVTPDAVDTDRADAGPDGPHDATDATDATVEAEADHGTPVVTHDELPEPPGSTQVLPVEHAEPDDTQVLSASPAESAPDDTQVLGATSADPAPGGTRVFPAATPASQAPDAWTDPDASSGLHDHGYATPAPAAGTDPFAASAASPVPAAPSVASGPAAPSAGSGAAVPVATVPAPLVSTGPRTSTVVWGLVVAVIGCGLLAQAAGASIDLQLATILLLGVAGVLLVVGSVVSAARRKRRRPTAA
jgi:hypothetical protein